LTVEMAARVLAALGSVSISRLIDTLQGYGALLAYLCIKGLRWRS
jgi:hypothetical protein